MRGRRPRHPRSRTETLLWRALQAGIALLVFALVAAIVTACGGGDGGDGTPSAALENEPTAAATSPSRSNAGEIDTPVDLADGLALGRADARSTLAVYEDFQCPVCLSFTLNLEPVIVDEYVQTGKLRLEFHNFPILGQESVLAAVGAVCAGEQDTFWQFHDALFQAEADAGQLEREQLDVGRFAPESLANHAEDVGMDVAAFNACIRSSETLSAVQADFNSARDAGLRGTPGFILDGRTIANPGTVQGWRQLLDEATR